MKQLRKVCAIIVVFLLMLETAFAEGGIKVADVTLNIDFSKREGTPLLKKFSVYNSGCTSLGHYERDAILLKPLDVSTLRVDLGMGGTHVMIGNKVVKGTAENPVYDYSDIERLAELLNEQNVLPYYAWCYLPYPINENGDNRKLNKDVENWRELWAQMLETSARYFRDKNLRIGYHEVYNEPDLHEMFLLESWDVYLDLYRYGAPALLRGDPDAVIGGPAAAFAQNSLQTAQFLKMIADEKLPLDFFSFHAYTSDNSMSSKFNVIYSTLAQYPELKNVELHLNELNVLSDAYTQDSICNFHDICPLMLDLFNDLLDKTDVTMVNWTQFMDIDFNEHAFGLVNRDGRVKAGYNTLKCYSDMPEERVAVSTSSRRILRAFASADDKKAAVLAWNRQEEDQLASIELNNIPYEKCQLRLYRIDEENADTMSGGTQHLAVLDSVEIQGSSYTWQGNVPGKSVVYLVLSPEGAEDFTPYLEDYEIGRHVRNHYWFEERKTDAYSWVDSRESAFYVGSGSRNDSRLLCGATFENVPDKLFCHIDGLTADAIANGGFAVRVDYANEEGFSTSMLLQAGNVSQYAFPFGTEKEADVLINAQDLSLLELPLADYAPADWNGRVLITVELCDSAENTNLVARLRAE